MAHTLAVSVGCASGIGPEVAVVAAVASRLGSRVLLVGDFGAVCRAARLRRIERQVVRVRSAAEGWRLRDAIPVLQPGDDLPLRAAVPGRPSAEGGAAQLLWIDTACDLVSSGEADALVTGPVSKHSISRSRSLAARRFIGHTEHLAKRLGAREAVMAFASEALTTALVTTHLPLANVARSITRENVASATTHLARLLFALGGRRKTSPMIAVASLNPHAGEGGLFGREESSAIVPGIALARRRLLAARLHPSIVGPVPAETAFRRAAQKEYDGVVAMYHDQATIPMKCLAFSEAVNVTLGLPIVRTSVDHGTGYDIAGKGVADAGGMHAAMTLALRLAKARLVTQPRSRSTD